MDHGDIITALRIRREARGWSQVDTARRAGVGQASVSQWERGHCVPVLTNLLDWAEALGCELVLRERRPIETVRTILDEPTLDPYLERA